MTDRAIDASTAGKQFPEHPEAAATASHHASQQWIDELFTTKGAVYAAGSVAALALAVRFAPSAAVNVAGEAAESLGANVLKAAGRSSSAIAGEAERVLAKEAIAGAATTATEDLATISRARVETVRIPSFNSVRPTGRADGVLSELEEKALTGAENTPKMIGVKSDSWLARIYEETRPAVVGIERQPGKHAGTGFFVDSDKRLLATAHHVVAGLEDATHTVRLHTGEALPARVIGFDEDADVAVLKLAGKVSGNEARQFQTLRLGTPLDLESKRAAAIGLPQGNDATAVISPGAFKSAAYTSQSRLHFSMKTFFGNSGGPIVGRDGSAISLVKNGVEAGEHSGPDTIGANIEHLRSLLSVVRDREISHGPLAVESEILSRGRAMLSPKDIFALRDNPELAAKIKTELSVKLLPRSVPDNIPRE
jgi:S1-C subfamily serine protease